MKEESLNWRDRWKSKKQRSWNQKLYCTDIDCVLSSDGKDINGEFVVVEWKNNAEPKAIIEYKDSHWIPNIYDINILVICTLADKANLPFFVVIYNKENVTFTTIPRNELAKKFVPEKIIYEEQDYINFLEEVRNVH